VKDDVLETIQAAKEAVMKPSGITPDMLLFPDKATAIAFLVKAGMTAEGAERYWEAHAVLYDRKDCE
jgi:hypothetical protein